MMATYTIFVPMPSDPRFGDFYETAATSLKKAFSNVFFRIHGHGVRHNYAGWRWKIGSRGREAAKKQI